MLVRIVRMTFTPSDVDAFLAQFDESAPQIRAVSGCQHLELWRDVDTPAVCTTYSHWTSKTALNRYRNSDLFQSTWAAVKPLFDAQPVAHSYTISRPASTISASSSTSDPPS